MSEHPHAVDLRLVPSALCAWAGCAWAVAQPPGAVLALACVAAVAAAALLPVARARGPRRRAVRGAASAWLAAATLALVLVAYAAQEHVRTTGPLSAFATQGATVEVVGRVRAEVAPLRGRWTTRVDDQRFRTVVEVDRVSGRGRTTDLSASVLVLGGAGWEDVPFGAVVRARGRLRAAVPGTPASATLTAEDPVVVEPPGAVDARVGDLRRGLLDVTAGLPADARGLVPGTAVGDTSRIPTDLAEAMRVSGLTHLTAVSGGHVVVLSMTVLAIASALRVRRPVRAVLSALTLLAFVALVHPEPSVVRAAGMGLVGVAGMVLGRPSRAVAALSATVLVLLVIDPWLSRRAGFVLSVVATAAIVLLAPVLTRTAARVLPRGLAVALAVPVAAQAACAPVLLALTPAVSLYAVPANVLAAPVVAPATLLSLAATVTAPWAPALAHALAWCAAGATWWIAQVARTTARLPGASWPWPEGPGGAALLAVVTAAGLGALLVLGGRRP